MTGRASEAGDIAVHFLRLPEASRRQFMGSLTGEELVELEGDIDARVRGHLVDWCLLALSAAKQRPAALPWSRATAMAAFRRWPDLWARPTPQSRRAC